MGRGLHQHSKDIINAAIEILNAIKPTTVRSVCYQLFTRGLIDNMGKTKTGKISRLLTGARERDEIDWRWIVDETRAVEQAAQWSDGSEFIDSVVRQYRKDYWQDQPWHVEVISEKGTVRGVLASVLNEFGVPFRVMHGFASATTANDMAQAINHRGKATALLYVGDYDPSGLYMSEVDLPQRLERYGADPSKFELRRIALTRTHVLDGKLPSFPVESKTGDARHDWFVKRFGHTCWELDAMNPNDLRARVFESITSFLDIAAWNHMIDIEHAEQDSMEQFMGDWKRMLAGGRS
jgi:hypothetical protein